MCNGFFYAMNTLGKMGDSTTVGEITDWPDMPHRGVMLDIVRNFYPLDSICRVLDVMADLKLNVLHLHLSDDEAWRVEIPGLPALTAQGARRGYTLDETDCLYPMYNGGWDCTDKHSMANGFLTRSDFIAARNVEHGGEETQRCELSDDERYAVAVHEAGHALMSSLHRHKWIQVTVNGTLGNLGFLERTAEGALGWSERKLRESIDVALAGRVAETLLAVPTEGAASDFRKATNYATRLVCGGFGNSDELAVTPESAAGPREWERLRPKINALLTARRSHVTRLFKTKKGVLKKIADELVAKRVLFAEDVEHILHPARPTSR